MFDATLLFAITKLPNFTVFSELQLLNIVPPVKSVLALGVITSVEKADISTDSKL